MFEDFRMKKKLVFSLIFPSFGPSNKSGLGKSLQIVDLRAGKQRRANKVGGVGGGWGGVKSRES